MTGRLVQWRMCGNGSSPHQQRQDGTTAGVTVEVTIGSARSDSQKLAVALGVKLPVVVGVWDGVCEALCVCVGVLDWVGEPVWDWEGVPLPVPVRVLGGVCVPVPLRVGLDVPDGVLDGAIEGVDACSHGGYEAIQSSRWRSSWRWMYDESARHHDGCTLCSSE